MENATSILLGLPGVAVDRVERTADEHSIPDPSRVRFTGPLAPALGLLRRLGAVPLGPPPAASTAPADVLLGEFGRYLAGRRALTGPVITAYLHWARPFAGEVLCAGGVCRAGEVTAAEVAGFLAAQLPAMSRKSPQMTACAVRSLLRFLHAEAVMPADLTGVVPPVASWRLAGMRERCRPTSGRRSWRT